VLVCSSAAPAAVDLGWYNLQWPLSTTTDVGMPTENIYGQVWADGVTNQLGQGTGIMAQLGFGPTSDLPTGPSWSWSNMVYNVDVGNNDEYMGNILPTHAGTFAYSTRFSGDGGINWSYADLDGPNYDIGRGGVLTVTPEPASLIWASMAAAAALLNRHRRRLR
jgi:hypothetical protein